MSGRPRYLLDANALIEAKRHYYRFRLCPGFWECLCWHHKQGELASIDRIRGEIDRGKDDLSHWARTSFEMLETLGAKFNWTKGAGLA